MLDWLIVGGGLHGTLISRSLRCEGGVAADRIRVLDPYPEPLRRWHDCTRNVGTRYLRSPVVHHLGGRDRPLRDFARSAARSRGNGSLRGAYLRPSLPLFNAHVREICRRHGLGALRLVARAHALRRRPGGGLEVETDRGSLRARRVLLAIGAGDQPHWPHWAEAVRRRPGAPVHHVFDPDFDRARLPAWNDAVVVGGGLSAVETALCLAAVRPGRVTLLPRHPTRVHDFDTDPSWLGPRKLKPFQRQDMEGRRRLVDGARRRGSVPADAASELERACRDGRLRRIEAEVRELLPETRSTLRLRRGEALETDLVLLATGYERRRPGGEWLAGLADDLGLPCAPCGYPAVGADLGWGHSIPATAPLAELEIGPLAANIAGAMQAAERLRALTW